MRRSIFQAHAIWLLLGVFSYFALQDVAAAQPEVPPQLEGRGIASHLVQAAFDYAKANGWDVLPVCSYVQTWARRHPEVEPLLAR